MKKVWNLCLIILCVFAILTAGCQESTAGNGTDQPTLKVKEEPETTAAQPPKPAPESAPATQEAPKPNKFPALPQERSK